MTVTLLNKRLDILTIIYKALNLVLKQQLKKYDNYVHKPSESDNNQCININKDCSSCDKIHNWTQTKRKKPTTEHEIGVRKGY